MACPPTGRNVMITILVFHISEWPVRGQAMEVDIHIVRIPERFS
ncbi:MAG: hypothetical protein K0R51_2515 [Cytophagaceae bacterium]|nr:hypothetical protein [Cytophagaceae bacterium]